MCWAIWGDRNKHIHGTKIPPPDIRSRCVLNYLTEFDRADERWKIDYRPSSSSVHLSRSQLWSPPPVQFWKINVDAAWDASSTGIRVICRDDRGRILGGCCQSLNSSFPLPMAELKAIMKGVEFASSMGGSKLIVETDCLQTYNLLSQDIEIWNEVGTLVDNIRRRSLSGEEIVFSYVPRECNSIADAIAKRAKREKCNLEWRDDFPQWLVFLVSWPFPFVLGGVIQCFFFQKKREVYVLLF